MTIGTAESLTAIRGTGMVGHYSAARDANCTFVRLPRCFCRSLRPPFCLEHVLPRAQRYAVTRLERHLFPSAPKLAIAVQRGLRGTGVVSGS